MTRQRARYALGLLAGLLLALALSAGANARSSFCLPPLIKCTTSSTPSTTTTSTTTTTPPPSVLAYPGARYDGRQHGLQSLASIQVSADGQSLAQYVVLFHHGRCSDGHPYHSFGVGTAKGAQIDSSGRLSYTHPFSRAVNFDRTGHRVTGRERVSLRMTFEGNRVSGLIHAQFRSKRIKCDSGAVDFTAWRDGTPRAPLSNHTLSTGRYQKMVRKTRVAVVLVFLPLHLISAIQFKWSAKCQNGYTLHTRATFTNVPLTGSRFRASGASRVRTKGGVIAHEAYRLAGQFFNHSGYQVRWRYVFHVRYFRGARSAGGCDGTSKYTAALQRSG